MKCLKDQSRHFATSYEHIGDILLNNLQNLFKVEDNDIFLMDYVNVTPLYHADKYLLDADITSDEILSAIKQLEIWKAPRLVGVYENNCTIVANFVIYLVHKTISGQFYWDHINTTDLVLILKKKNLILPEDFRPSNLCNVIYKIIAKLFSNRLRLILF